MIKVKDDSVQVAHLSTGILLALIVADQVYQEYDLDTVITSGNDGEHSYTSLHYANEAVDLRTHGLSDTNAEQVRDLIAEALGTDYDVILELNHLHIECQPKRRVW